MIFILSVTVLCVLVILDYCYRQIVFKSVLSLPTYDAYNFPFIGQALALAGNGEERMLALQNAARLTSKVGGVLRGWMGFRMYLVVTEPDVAEMILKTFLEKDELMDIIHDITGNGSIFASVSIWRPRRKLLVRAFSPKILKNFLEIFDNASRDLVKQLEKVSGGGLLSVFPYISSCTMKSVCESNLGVEMSLENQHAQQFIKTFEFVVDYVSARLTQPVLNAVHRFLPRYRKFQHDKQVLDNFVNQVIQSKKKEKEQECNTDREADCEHKTPQPVQRPFIDVLMEHSEPERLTDIELRDECMVITIAGTDTSSVCASFVLCMLARHPRVQDRVYEELTEVFGNSNRSVTHEDLPKLSFLEAVMKETLRLYPPVPLVTRGVDKFVSLKSGQILVPGMCCLIHIWGIHRNPKYWGPDADQFHPDRFLNSTLPHPAAFIPFSHGPRNCIGYQYAMMSIKTILATVLRSFRVLPLPGHDTPAPEFTNYSGDEKPMRLQFEVMLKDADQFTIQLEKRKVEGF